ncbi:diadenylate cyclase [Candidatus Woesearchaeota archaeon]|nr:diadenylate cyclase [Candidatus Woesearchaeota archaeon]
MLENKKRKEEIYNFLLEIAQELSKRKLGALMVIAPKRKFNKIYEPLYPQIIAKHQIFEKGTRELILNLAELDGAFLIGDDGTFVSFGARIKKSKALPGYGTKHAAAVGITKHIKNSSAILVSEESGWVKIFKDGKIVLELDSTKKSPQLMHKVVNFITDNDTALIATAGVSAAITGVLPIVIVSGTYLAIKTASGIIKKSLGK